MGRKPLGKSRPRESFDQWNCFAIRFRLNQLPTACAHPINLCNSLGSGLSDPAPLRWMRQEPWLESAINFPLCELHCLGGLLSYLSGIWTSGITVFGFSSSGFCNISGGPSRIPITPAPWAAGLVARPSWNKGILRPVRRCATRRCSGFSFRLVFLFSEWPSPYWIHWRDGLAHQERPQDQVRPWGQSPVRSYRSG